MENLVDDVQSQWLQYNRVLYCVKYHLDREVSIEASGHRSVELQ